MDWLSLMAACAAGAGVGRIGRWASHRARPPAPVPRGSCEVGTAAVWAAVFTLLPLSAWPAWWLPVPLLLGAFAVPLAVVDLRHRRLPDILTLAAYPVFGLALVGAALGASSTALAARAACAALLFAAAHAAVRAAAPHALGAGDVKLAGSLGAVLGAVGWASLPVAACLAAILSASLAAAAALIRCTSWRGGVPHGPGLLVATWCVTMFPGGAWR